MKTSKGSEQEEPRAQGLGGKALVWDGGRGQGSLTLEGAAEIATPGQGEGPGGRDFQGGVGWSKSKALMGHGGGSCLGPGPVAGR